MRSYPLDITKRHFSVQAAARWFDFEHLQGDPRTICSMFSDFKDDLLISLDDGPELTLALRALAQAKDYAIHQVILDIEKEKGTTSANE